MNIRPLALTGAVTRAKKAACAGSGDRAMPVSESLRRQQALASLRLRLLWLVGCLGLLLVAVAVWGLLAVDSANRRQQEALATATQLLRTVDQVREAQIRFKEQVQEWKNLLLRGDDPKDYANYWAAFQSDEKDVNTLLITAAAKLKEAQLATKPIDEFLASHAVLAAAYREAIKSYRPGDLPTVLAVDDKVRGIDRAPMNLLDNYVVALVAASKNRITQMAETSRDRVDFDKKIREAMLLAVTAGLALALVFSVRSVARVEKLLEEGS
jgi:hypothetical protein